MNDMEAMLRGLHGYMQHLQMERLVTIRRTFDRDTGQYTVTFVLFDETARVWTVKQRDSIVAKMQELGVEGTVLVVDKIREVRMTWEAKLDALLDLDDGLTDWEVEFVESLNKQRKRQGWEPSPKQEATLERIYDQRT